MDATRALAELGFVFVILGVAGALARRIGTPAIPLYLMAGIGVGVGGVIQLDDAQPVIEVGAGLGMIMLLLAIGMEFSPAELTSSLQRQWASGLLDALLSAIPGAIAGLLLGLEWPGALALAGITWVSSSGIAVKMLTELGRLGNRETPSVLSVLVIEDIAMAVYLPVTAVLLLGGDSRLAITGVGVGVAALVIAFLASRIFGRQLAGILGGASDEQAVIRTVGFTILIAALAEFVHVSAAVGAFLVGLSLNGAAASRITALITPLRDLFAGLFFISFGMAINPLELGPVLPAALLLATVGGLAKYAVGRFAARVDGASGPGRARAGTALIARGEFSLVIAGLAVIAMPGSQIGALTSTYVLLLAIVGPILCKYSGRRVRSAPVSPAVATAPRVAP